MVVHRSHGGVAYSSRGEEQAVRTSYLLCFSGPSEFLHVWDNVWNATPGPQHSVLAVSHPVPRDGSLCVFYGGDNVGASEGQRASPTDILADTQKPNGAQLGAAACGLCARGAAGRGWPAGVKAGYRCSLPRFFEYIYLAPAAIWPKSGRSGCDMNGTPTGPAPPTAG